ncbi:hypothetical protein ACLOAU_16730 [Niabella sp. CJ426]|uniref:hypothetical protein n=1 Tax=Niabella sp. CJ426 TaxID=3393740 RepID=UPI003D04158D
MSLKKVLIEKVDYAIQLADDSMKTHYSTGGDFISQDWVSNESFQKFKSFSLSFISSTFAESHPYYEQFKKTVTNHSLHAVEAGRGILTSVKIEIEKDWVADIRSLISSEIFSDFLEMAEHLIDEKYEHAAAVMIGSVLEEHLRNLCQKYGIDTTEERHGKVLPKKADLLNSDLAKSKVYNILTQKNITAWLDLRNKAAHGKYNEYNFSQVDLMLRGVSEFAARVN